MPTTKQVFPFPGCSLATAQLCIPAGRTLPLIVDLRGAERVTVQGATVGTTAWSSAVVAVRVSNSPDGPWVSIPGNPVTMTAAGMTQPIDVSQYAYLSLECTTAQASVVADFWICTYAGDVPWYSAYLPNVARTSGKRYYGGAYTLGSNGALTQNTLYAIPFWVGPPQTFTKIVVASLGVASSHVRVGIYADDGTSKPGNLIVDAGQLDTSTSGEKTATINVTVSGLIWVAGVAQDAAASTTRMGGTFSPFLGHVSSYAQGPSLAYSQGSITGALPNPWGSTYTDVTAANTVPLVALSP